MSFCTRRVELEGDDALAILDGTAILPAGRIVFYGSFHTGLSFRHVAAVPFAITGGTGSYDAARGTVVTRAGKLKGAEGTVLDFEVVLG